MKMRVISRAQDKELAVNNNLYLGDGDFDTVYALCMEHKDIGMTCSSTPTGRRSKFYEICTNKQMGFTEHHHPTQHNPAWSESMEAEFHATYDQNAYVHEVLAEFGVEEAGVFNKEMLETATRIDNYTYFDKEQYRPVWPNLEEDKVNKIHILEPGATRYASNPWRCVGVDWD